MWYFWRLSCCLLFQAVMCRVAVVSRAGAVGGGHVTVVRLARTRTHVPVHTSWCVSTDGCRCWQKESARATMSIAANMWATAKTYEDQFVKRGCVACPNCTKPCRTIRTSPKRITLKLRFSSWSCGSVLREKGGWTQIRRDYKKEPAFKCRHRAKLLSWFLVSIQVQLQEVPDLESWTHVKLVLKLWDWCTATEKDLQSGLSSRNEVKSNGVCNGTARERMNVLSEVGTRTENIKRCWPVSKKGRQV